MPERKGQHLFNEISKRYKLQSITKYHEHGNGTVTPETYPYVNLHKILFYMDDKEFDEIMQETKVTEGLPK